ncbi:MAG: rhomboid family intramembrane serine protease [Acidobacteriota bacterium]
MFPISDDNSEIRIIPFVTYILIGLNVLVFCLLQGFGTNETFTYAFSLVPKEITTGIDLTGIVPIGNSRIQHEPALFGVYFNFLSSMFMHGDFMHIIGNMLFLWIFADNIENRIGHIRFAIFYVICGFAAAFAQVFMDTGSVIPMLGASGAISGVLGGYLLLFPNKQVRAIMFSFMMTTIPAFVALGLWIGFQLIQGYLSSNAQGGVAYAAHIGGFVAGLLLIKPFTLGTSDSQQ